MFEKNLDISYLLDFYGNILPDKKRDVLDLYYNEDLSLSEIADNIGISRQGVRDIIKKTENELLFYEEKLGLASRFKEAEFHANNMRKILDNNNPCSKELDDELALLMQNISSK